MLLITYNFSGNSVNIEVSKCMANTTDPDSSFNFLIFPSEKIVFQFREDNEFPFDP